MPMLNVDRFTYLGDSAWSIKNMNESRMNNGKNVNTRIGENYCNALM